MPSWTICPDCGRTVVYLECDMCISDVCPFCGDFNACLCKGCLEEQNEHLKEVYEEMMNEEEEEAYRYGPHDGCD